MASTIRITPACAGKSVRALPARREKEDHPRVCGEKFTAYAKRSTRQGSPPRVRGKVLLRVLRHEATGITPACAGKRKRILQ